MDHIVFSLLVANTYMTIMTMTISSDSPTMQHSSVNQGQWRTSSQWNILVPCLLNNYQSRQYLQYFPMIFPIFKGFITTQLSSCQPFQDTGNKHGVRSLCLLFIVWVWIPTSYQHIGIPIIQPKWKPSCKPLNNPFVSMLYPSFAAFTWVFPKKWVLQNPIKMTNVG